MGPLGHLWTQLDHLKNIMRVSLILINYWNYLSNVYYFWDIATAKNRILGGKEYWQLCLKTGVRKVISKRRSSLVWEGTEGPFRENISTKVNKTIKSKKKTTELLKEYIKPTSTKRPYHYESCQLQFIGRGHQSYQNQGSMPRHGQRKLYSRGGRCKLESQPPIWNLHPA